ncbi:trypsin-like peptidase domain-containing protein [Dactylosporangium sp. NPDC051484]|uniref:S1C family serine protease n=1 Tax=Dactylosporangium sp. NPDC051484 TaxID=3154942 RepID=UPI00344C8EC1
MSAPHHAQGTGVASVGGMDRYGPRRRIVGSTLLAVLLVVLAALVGVAGLSTGVRSQPPGPRPSVAAQENAAPPALFGDVPSDPPSEAAPTPTEAPDPAAIISSVNRSVVDINSTLGLRNARAAGTGVVLTGTGLVLTNNHVVAGATSITARAVANGRTFHASVVGYDRSHDIAVIQLAGATGLPRLAVADSSSVRVGDPIIAVGNAGGVGGTPTAVTGSVTALEQSITAQEPDGGAQQLTGLIQVAADIRSGDSGGPLVDRSGRLIGINTAASIEEQGQAAGGTGFAIPSNTAVGIAQQIQAGKASPTVHLGPTALLGVAAADAEGRAAGAAVTGVIAGSPAERAGLSAGDVIRSVDGRPVGSARELTSVLDTYHPGDRVTIAWVDQAGQSGTATVTLAAGPAG